MTDSLEEYLYTIYVLLKKYGIARVTDIANQMEVTKASTSNALNILKNQGLINYEKYKDITITQNGLARAKYIERRHELFRKFLKDIIKTDENLVETETEKLAHCISCHTAAKLEKFIENYMSSITNIWNNLSVKTSVKADVFLYTRKFIS